MKGNNQVYSALEVVLTIINNKRQLRDFSTDFMPYNFSALKDLLAIF